VSDNAAIEAAAKQMAQSKVFGDYVYLNRKFGRYECRFVATKVKPGPKVIFEMKVLKAQKTVDGCEPHRVGDVVSYLENLGDPRKGGGSRATKCVLTALGMKETDISRIEFVDKDGVKNILSGEDAKSFWFMKMLNEQKAPCVGLLVEVEVYPKEAGSQIARERWSTIDPSDAQMAEIEKFRDDAKLPSLAEALK
jgi:hypothetical protein